MGRQSDGKALHQEQTPQGLTQHSAYLIPFKSSNPHSTRYLKAPLP